MISAELEYKILYYGTTTAIAVVCVGLLASIFLLTNYSVWLADQGNQAACEAAFGPSASYIGDVSGGSGIICTTPDGPKLTDGQTKRMSLRTWWNYLDAVLAGQA